MTDCVIDLCDKYMCCWHGDGGLSREDHPELNSKQPRPKQPSPFLLFIRGKKQAFMEKHPQVGISPLSSLICNSMSV